MLSRLWGDDCLDRCANERGKADSTFAASVALDVTPRQEAGWDQWIRLREGENRQGRRSILPPSHRRGLANEQSGLWQPVGRAVAGGALK